MIKGKKILVAGGTGLIGANLVQKLRALGADVRGTCFSRKFDSLGLAKPDPRLSQWGSESRPPDNPRSLGLAKPDPRLSQGDSESRPPDNPKFLPEVFDRFDFTELDQCVAATRDTQYVFICAAQTFGAKIMRENPTALVLPNLRINSGLLEACRLNKVEKVVFISSSTVYQEAFYPIREEELDLNKPTYDLYLGVGGMKRYVEQLARFYHKVYGMQIGIVRPTNIYGPHDKFDDDKSHVLPALIKRALKKENPYVVWGDGYTVRDFIYVDDFVDDLLNILDRYCICDPLNVSSGTRITIREAVKVILEACGHCVDPQYDETKPNAIPYRMLNTTKFEAIFGKKKRTPFEEGIQKTVAWYGGSQGGETLEPH